MWIAFTVFAAALQTARNAMQRDLTQSLGTVGATHIRFMFGFPFAVIFLIVVTLATGLPLPRPPWVYWLWIADGFGAQFAATALMLSAMTERSFLVTIAYIKTEPVQVALIALVLLGDPLTPLMALAIVVATTGVIVMSTRNGGSLVGGWRPTLKGLAAGGLFGLSAVGYRGALLSISEHNYIMAATFTVTMGLAAQAIILTAWLVVRDRAVLRAIARQWRPSVTAGFLGALASQFWYLAFAIATAASVRTLALVEVLFAQAVTHLVFKQRTTRRETFGVVLIVAGCVLLIWAY